MHRDLDRRSFLSLLFAGTGAVGAAALGGWAVARHRRRGGAARGPAPAAGQAPRTQTAQTAGLVAAGPDVRALFGDLAVPGHRLQRWSVVAVHDVTLGAIPAVLAAANWE